MSRQRYRVVDAETGTVLLHQVERAEGWLGRGLGLLGRPRARAGGGLWIEPCHGVHTFGMRFALDILVLDRESQVLAVHWHVRPWRIVLPRRGDHGVLEVPIGRLTPGTVRTGMRLRLEPNE